MGLTTQRLKKPIIKKGLAVMPHETGVRVVMGVPQLTTNTKVRLSKTMAIEVDVGCMDLGVLVSRSTWNLGLGIDGFEIWKANGLGRNYTGPQYMESVLLQTVNDIRAHIRPFFKPYYPNGDMMGIAESKLSLSSAERVQSYDIPFASDPFIASRLFMGNCTEALRRQLGLLVGATPIDGTMCSLLGIGGTRLVEGVPYQGFVRMVCSAATQVNMVDATVQVDAQGDVSLDISRLPSVLTHVKADYWDTTHDTPRTRFPRYEPYERYTLGDNASSPTAHFIQHTQPDYYRRLALYGHGTAGNIISYMGHFILSLSRDILSGDKKRTMSVSILDEGLDYLGSIRTNNLTRWLGQVGGSYVLGSLAYNGWAALQAKPVEVISTGGHEGLWYNPLYALGFAPLVFSAVAIVCWTILLVLRGSWFGHGAVKAAYGGVSPYTAAICPGAPSKETLAAWESSSEPHLRVLSGGFPLVGEAGDTALNYFKSSSANP